MGSQESDMTSQLNYNYYYVILDQETEILDTNHFHKIEAVSGIWER